MVEAKDDKEALTQGRLDCAQRAGDAMLRSNSISFSQNDSRRDRRLLMAAVSVTFGAEQYAVRDWSLGGFLIEAAPELEVGSRHVGQLRVAGQDTSFVVVVDVVRSDAAERTLACRFIDPAPAVIEALNDAVAARLAGPRGSAGAVRPQAHTGLNPVAMTFAAAAAVALAAAAAFATG
jgi:hypothetical protein